jgi:hypothetical protein
MKFIRGYRQDRTVYPIESNTILVNFITIAVFSPISRLMWSGASNHPITSAPTETLSNYPFDQDKTPPLAGEFFVYSR